MASVHEFRSTATATTRSVWSCVTLQDYLLQKTSSKAEIMLG